MYSTNCAHSSLLLIYTSPINNNMKALKSALYNSNSSLNMKYINLSNKNYIFGNINLKHDSVLVFDILL